MTNNQRENVRLTDRELVNAKHLTTYGPDVPLTHGVSDRDRAVADAATDKVLERVKSLIEAAETIFSVAVNANVGDKRVCPHGNAPFFPAHGRWCEDCFSALDDALANLGVEVEP